MANRRTVVLIAIAACLLAATAFKVFSSTRPTPEAYVNGVVGCLNAHDAECLTNQVSDGELGLYGISRAQATNVIKSYVIPTLPKEAFIKQELSGGAKSRTTLFTLADKSGEWRIDFDVAPVDGRITSAQLFTSLWLHAGWERNRAAVYNQPKQLFSLMGMREIARVDAPLLTSMGVRGVLRRPDEGLISFDLWAKMLDQRIIAAKEGLKHPVKAK